MVKRGEGPDELVQRAQAGDLGAPGNNLGRIVIQIGLQRLQFRLLAGEHRLQLGREPGVGHCLRGRIQNAMAPLEILHADAR